MTRPIGTLESARLFWSGIDKTGWGEGPWQDEADKVQWIDTETGLDCLAVRHPEFGHWCGYVGIPETHPLFGVDDANADLQAHGGVNFSGRCQEGEDGDETRLGICHIPLPGRPDRVWWFGFDCAHAGDLSPGIVALMASLPPFVPPFPIPPAYAHLVRPDRYKTFEYVEQECAGLAEQLKEAA